MINQYKKWINKIKITYCQSYCFAPDLTDSDCSSSSGSMHKKSDAVPDLNYLFLHFDYLNFDYSNFGNFECDQQMTNMFDCLWDGSGSSNLQSEVFKKVCTSSLYCIGLKVRTYIVGLVVLPLLGIGEGSCNHVKNLMSNLLVYFVMIDSAHSLFIPFELVIPS